MTIKEDKYMFEKLMGYVKRVDDGDIVQKVDKKPYGENLLSPDNDYFDNQRKRLEIKNYIESRIHGITVEVTGGEKLIPKEDKATRNPIKIRTFKNNEPYSYNEMLIYGCLEEINYADMVYNQYLENFINNKNMKTGKISTWEHIIAEWMEENYYPECGYCCDNNSLYKMNDKEQCTETIIADIEAEVEGIVVTNYNWYEEIEEALVIICAEKQVLIAYQEYYIMETY